MRLRPRRAGGAWPQLARIGVFLLASSGALAVMLAGPGYWRWPLGFGLWLLGAGLAQAAFGRLATREQIRQDMRERLDSAE